MSATRTARRRSSSRTRRPRRSPEEVRDRIYTVALRRIRETGFEDTSVSQVTREADVAKGTFFNHYATKDHLLARALDEILTRVLDSASSGPGGTDAVTAVLNALALEMAHDPSLARAIVPRLGTLPPTGTPGAGVDEAADLPAHERLRRWIRDRLSESLRLSVPLEEPDDQTLSVLLVAVFEATLREWLSATGGEPPFPRGLLHARAAYLLVSAGFARPPSPS